MAYCRFGEGDVYLFYNSGGYIGCCSCCLAPKVKSRFTKGWSKKSLFDKCESCGGKGCEECWCKSCKGIGCDGCMLHGSLYFDTFEEAIDHLYKHKENGDDFPEEAIEELKRDIEREGKPTPSIPRENK